MPLKLENVGIAVRDLEATIAFFTGLWMTVLGRDTVSGEWADIAVGLDGDSRLELVEYLHPATTA